MKNWSIVLLSLLLAACQPSPSQTSEHRYIVTSPELAEILHELGAADAIVGLTTECTWPVDFESVPKVGTFGQIDAEKVIALHPTHVFTSKLEQQAIGEQLHKLNIPVYSFYPSTIDGLFSVIDSLAELTSRQDAAQQLTTRMQAALDSLAFQRDLRSSNQPDVYVEIYGTPVMSVADNSFVGELIELAGGNNIFTELPRDYSRINPETVVTTAPDIMLITYPGITPQQIAARKGWQSIPAIQNERIYTTQQLNPDLILRATPRCIQGIKELQRIFYE
jgi:ABC-type Fe3+-hydroxamate transport system substrate-binding protein